MRLGFLLAPALGGVLYAHHFLVASYDFSRTVTVEGRVERFLFRRPHSYVQVETAGAVSWLAEWGDASQLSRAGVNADSLKPDDRVSVTGNPARDSKDHKLRIVRIARPSDGWNWDGSN